MALDLNRIVNVEVKLSPKVGNMKGFGTLAIIGDSDVIVGSRYESFSTFEDVANRFGSVARETLAAQVYFSQSPKPSSLVISRWFNDAEKATLVGGTGVIFNALKVVADGAFDINIDGVVQKVTGLDLTATTNLNGVASSIQAKLTGATCVWDGKRFVVQSDSMALVAEVGYATTPTTGTATDISTLLKLTATTAQPPVPVKQAETALEALQALSNETRAFYSVYFVGATLPTDDDFVAIAGYVEALSDSKMLLVQTSNTQAVESKVTTDIGSRLKDLSYLHTFVMFDNDDSHAICAIAGCYSTVNYDGRSTVKTVMHKVAVGVTAEDLTTSQANALQSKNINVFARYNNDTAIIQYGTVASGKFIDSVIGFDWLRFKIQTDVYNLFLSANKIPMTNSGLAQIATAIRVACNVGVRNGLINSDGGVWGLPDVEGVIRRGDIVPNGYLVDYEPVESLSSDDRQNRKSPPFYVYVIEAGAIHVVPLISIVVSQ